jgi:hypothetical protein
MKSDEAEAQQLVRFSFNTRATCDSSCLTPTCRQDDVRDDERFVCHGHQQGGRATGIRLLCFKSLFRSYSDHGRHSVDDSEGRCCPCAGSREVTRAH